MNNNSSRHHYIPVFLVKGFTNNDGQVYVYDKLKDQVYKKPRYPKGVFFEWNRNTFDFGYSQSTIIEDNTYGKIDNIGGQAVNFLRSVDLTGPEIPLKHIYRLQVFILNLFWRIPSTDKVFDIIYEIINSDTRVELKEKDWLKKHQRTYMFLHTLNVSLENISNTNHKYKIIEFLEPNFILTDNPTLYDVIPKEFENLDKIQYVFPLSDKRGFLQFLESSDKSNKNQFEGKHAYWYNALAIEQSVRYSASGDLDVLNNSLKFYKYIVENKKEKGTRDLLFDRIKF